MVEGRVTLEAAGEKLELVRGEAVFVSASVARYSIEGVASLYRAGVVARAAPDVRGSSDPACCRHAPMSRPHI